MKLIWLVLSPVAAVLLAALGELVSEEIRARLDRISFALLAAAAKRLRLPASQRAEVHDQWWLPELHHILRSDEAMPITRLVHGTRYAMRLWLAAPAISRELAPEAARQHWIDRARQALRDFGDRPVTYGDQLVGWCFLTGLVYGMVSFHGHARGIVLIIWYVLFFVRALVKQRFTKRGKQGDPVGHASTLEVVLCWYLLAPALAVTACSVGVMDICVLASGRGSVGTWFGLCYGVLFGPFPWVERFFVKAAARARAGPGQDMSPRS